MKKKISIDINQWLNRTIQGDNLKNLKLLPDNSVDICISSPSYYGLRDYGTAVWTGGDTACEHRIKKMKPTTDIMRNSTLKGGHQSQREGNVQQRQVCDICGAVRKDDQVGIEATPEAYIKRLVKIFEEVRRVLKPTGTLWLNLADTYFGGGGASGHTAETMNLGKKRLERMHEPEGVTRKLKSDYLKPKDLIMIPARVAIALQHAGWYLRQDIIWKKGQAMPESVTDRCTKAHEYFFLLSKSRKYYYDHEAIKTAPTDSTIARMSQQIEKQKGSARAVGKTNGPMKAVGGGYQGSKKGIPALPGRPGSDTPWGDMTKTEQQAGGANKRSVWDVMEDTSAWKWLFNTYPEEYVLPLFEQFLRENCNDTDVWEVNPKGFKDAHFATFPEELVVDPVKAGTSEHGNCKNCGKPYERITEPVIDVKHTGKTDTQYGEEMTAGRLAKLRQAAREQGQEYSSDRRTIGWRKTCACDTTEISAPVVLDPFHGAGTTGLVARKLGRNFIGLELNPDYIKMSEKRIHSQMLKLF